MTLVLFHLVKLYDFVVESCIYRAPRLCRVGALQVQAWLGMAWPPVSFTEPPREIASRHDSTGCCSPMQPIHERESPELDSPTDEFFSSKVRLQSHVRPRFQQGLLRSHTQKKKSMNASFHHAESNGSNESSGGWRTPSKLVRLEFEQCCLPWEDEYGNSARHALHRFASVQRPQEVRNCARPQKYTVYAVYHYIYIYVYVCIYIYISFD